MNKILIGSALGLLLAPGIALSAGNQVVLTDGGAKSGLRTVALDLAVQPEATAFEFSIRLPKGVQKVDTTRCLADLPSSHQGKCVYRKDVGDVFVIAFSPTNARLGGEIVSLGTIAVSGGEGPLSVQEVVFASEAGKRLEGSSFDHAKPGVAERDNK